MKNRHCGIARCVLPGLLLMSFFSAAASPQKRPANRSRDHAFIVYWPPPENSKQLRLAVKDLIDMKGVVTTAGSEYLARTSPPASQDAKCLELARERNVQIVGKTNLTEFAVTVSGKNSYFGTPRNLPDGKHRFIPGGSSSGSAVAVEIGMADVAFGTDTAGSIRLPAACCGILGLKTTFGLVPIKGVFPISPKHLDTVGPMAKDMTHLVQGMDLLQRGFAARYESAVAANPSAKDIRIGRLYLDGTDPAIDKALDDALAAKRFKVIKLDQAFKAKWEQAQKDGKTVAFADVWFNDQKYTDKKGVRGTTKTVINLGKQDSTNNYKDALKRQAAWQRDLRQVFKKVDFIALPTLQKLPPKFPFFGRTVVFELEVFSTQNTAAVNF
ncbi:MAG TPA: amidase, partial [Chthoniobacterales bacterium]|nr:amidase [Chthoniobacterales bacterium]